MISDFFQMPFLQTVTDLSRDADVLRLRRYGVIEVVDGRLRRVLLRPWPKILVGPEVLWLGRWMHQRRGGDRLLLYYNHPWRFPKFLALAYALSARETSLRSVHVGLGVLDEIARLKKSDALLCDAGNWRISERLMRRFGWTPHCPSSWWHRHFIKRFHGKYPERSQHSEVRSQEVEVDNEVRDHDAGRPLFPSITL
jgi:hypothetical protein